MSLNPMASASHNPNSIIACYSWYWKAFGWAALAIGLVLACVGATRPTQQIGPVASFMLIASIFVVLTTPILLETHFVAIEVTNDAIHARSPWRRARSIPLESVQSCRFSQLSQWYLVDTDLHGKIRLHTYLSGLPQILWCFLAKFQDNRFGFWMTQGAGCTPTTAKQAPTVMSRYNNVMHAEHSFGRV